MSESEKLQLEISEAENKLKKNCINMVKSFSDESDNAKIEELALQYFTKLRESTKKSLEMEKSLSECKTMEDVKQWRIQNNI